MKKENEKQVSERLRDCIKKELNARGKFSYLERESGIPEGQWKNFFYKKQEATDAMLAFWESTYPDYSHYIKTGKRFEKRTEDERLIFGAAAPKKNQLTTLKQRFGWVVREWAAPRGEALFYYLAETTDGKISGNEWAEVLLGPDEPTFEMIQHVTKRRPHFALWLLHGEVDSWTQVDPTDVEASRAWNKSRLKF